MTINSNQGKDNQGEPKQSAHRESSASQPLSIVKKNVVRENTGEVKQLPTHRESPQTAKQQVEVEYVYALPTVDTRAALIAFLEESYTRNTQGHITDFQVYQRLINWWKSNYKGVPLPTRYEVRTALLLHGYRFQVAYNVARWNGIAAKKRTA